MGRWGLRDTALASALSEVPAAARAAEETGFDTLWTAETGKTVVEERAKPAIRFHRANDRNHIEARRLFLDGAFTAPGAVRVENVPLAHELKLVEGRRGSNG